MKKLPIFLALRLSASSDGRKSTPAVKVAIAAVALSVAVMLAAIAIVMGFRTEITRKVLGFNPHIVLRANSDYNDGSPVVSLSPRLVEILDSLPYVKSYSLGASSPAIFKTENDFKGVYVKATDKGEMSDFLKSQLIAGKMPDFDKDSDAVVISELAARQLGLKVGDKLPTYYIIDDVHIRPLKISGIYNSHFDAYDDIFAFTGLSAIQEIGDLSSRDGTYINIYINDFDKVVETATDLRKVLMQNYLTGETGTLFEVETALMSGANYFSWLQLLNMNVVIIIILMTIVAAITLISGMMIIIVDKTRFIAIMKSLGAKNGILRRTFIWLTLKVALSGLIIGNIIMLGLLFIQESTHFIPLNPENYYIDFVPVSLDWLSIVILNVAILIISYVLLMLPSAFVSSISPAKSLNTE